MNNQEPVAWLYQHKKHKTIFELTNHRSLELDAEYIEEIPLYTAPPSKQDTRLKVKLGRQYGFDLNGHWFYLQPADEYAEAALTKHSGISAPSSKPWVSLTFEDVAELGFEIGEIDTDRDLYRFALAIEAASRSKNNG